MATADTKVFRNMSYLHEEGESFASKADARRHGEWLKKQHSFIKHIRIEKRPNGSYWIWYSWHQK